MESFPHAFISAGRAVRDQIIDIASTVFGAAPEWSGGAEVQLTRIENAGGSEAATIIEPEGEWDIWGGAHHLVGLQHADGSHYTHRMARRRRLCARADSQDWVMALTPGPSRQCAARERGDHTITPRTF